ncbi:hypothetical protein MRB53_034493 [Persea americana]|uniref:Uncharacterized protein n=1 Tax=Persea americana TaxID=3435 RepID=A0ACC2K1W1_PERAE|nr:hypothetical protein MRB53_034493 [Persea americana]
MVRLKSPCIPDKVFGFKKCVRVLLGPNSGFWMPRHNPSLSGKNLPKRDKNPRRLGKKREERNSTFSVLSLFLSLSDIQSSVRSDSTGYITRRGFCVSQQGYRVEIDN